MKKYFFKVFPWMFACFLLLAGCSMQTTPSSIGGISLNAIYYPSKPAIIGMSGTLTLLGDSLDDLYEEADIVVVANVIDDQVAQYENHYVSNCLSKIQVISVYKGTVAVNDELIIRELGARDGELDKEYSLDGVPLLHNDMCVLLFLRNAAELPNGMTGHTICGEYQGKFIFDNQGMLHESAELGADSFTVIDNMDVMTYSHVTSQLQTMRTADLAAQELVVQ